MTNLVGDASVLSALREDQQHPAAATTKQPHAGEKRRRCERRMKAAKRSAIPCKQSSAAIGELVIVLQSCRTRAIQQRLSLALKVSLLLVPRQCANIRRQPSAKKLFKKWSHNHKMEENSTKKSDKAI